MRNIPNWIGPEIPSLSPIGALMYLANTTRPDIDFSINLLARYISAPIRRHENGIKHKGLFYCKDYSPSLIGHADVGYLSNPYKAQSQTGYVFISGGTVHLGKYIK